MEVNETKHSHILKVMDSQKFSSRTIIFSNLYKKLKKSDPRTENPEVHTYSECLPKHSQESRKGRKLF